MSKKKPSLKVSPSQQPSDGENLKKATPPSLSENSTPIHLDSEEEKEAQLRAEAVVEAYELREKAVKGRMTERSIFRPTPKPNPNQSRSPGFVQGDGYSLLRNRQMDGYTTPYMQDLKEAERKKAAVEESQAQKIASMVPLVGIIKAFQSLDLGKLAGEAAGFLAAFKEAWDGKKEG